MVFSPLPRAFSALAPRSCSLLSAPVILVSILVLLACLASARAQSYVGEIKAADIGGMGPTAVAVDRTLSPALLYIADEQSGRILKYNAETGARIAVYGSVGYAPGQFNRPYGIAIDPVSHDLYVAERGNGRVQRITNNGVPVLTWGEYRAEPNSAQGYFNEPIGIAADADGYVYVVDKSNNRIQKFRVVPNGTGWTVQNHGMWGSTGSGAGQLNRPYGLALDAAGTLWVAEGDNSRVQRFSKTGASLQILGTRGTANGQFTLPTAVAVDASGAVFVTETNTDPQNGNAIDIQQQRVQRFTSAGAYDNFRWGSYGSGPGQFALPFGIALGPQNRAFVADYYNQRVQIFDLGAPTPTAPVISSPSTASGTVGTAFSFQIVASPTPSSYSATNLPPGLTLNSTSGAITGTPTTAGQYNVTLGAHNANGTGTQAATFTLQASSTPPGGWQSTDIGAVAAAGTTTESGGTIVVRGSGADIWDLADEFRYHAKPLSGDGEIVARLASLENTHGWAKAGVMMRETLQPYSRHVFVCVSAANGTALQSRTATGAYSASMAGTWSTAPQWVKLVRSGSTFTGYTSANGQTWTHVGSVSVELGSSIHAGLAVTSHNDGTLCAATFDNVTLSAAGSAPAPSAPAAPSGLTATASSALQVQLIWTDNATNETAVQVERSTGGGAFSLVANLGANATSYTDSTVTAGTAYTYRARAFNGSAASTFSNTAAVTTPASTTPPSVWQSTDIGAVGIAGSDDAGGATITVRGSGSDIWGSADAFRFLYQALSGNCTVEARVTTITQTDGWAKAGVMIREGLAPGARNIALLLTPTNGVHAQVRATAAGQTTSTSGPWGITAPQWVRLTRAGDTITAATSADGVAWTTVSTATLALGSQVYVGFAVTSHNNAALCTATFSEPYLR